jgi:hypothetical protein
MTINFRSPEFQIGSGDASSTEPICVYGLPWPCLFRKPDLKHIFDGHRVKTFNQPIILFWKRSCRLTFWAFSWSSHVSGEWKVQGWLVLKTNKIKTYPGPTHGHRVERDSDSDPMKYQVIARGDVKECVLLNICGAYTFMHRLPPTLLVERWPQPAPLWQGAMYCNASAPSLT